MHPRPSRKTRGPLAPSSVTAAASRLYLTQPAISAALRRLYEVVGAPLFVREGRRLALTARGHALLAHARPALQTLVDAALSPGAFDPRGSDRTLRLGLSDASESWLLPPLLRCLEHAAPHMRLVVLPVQFRTVGDALTTHAIDLAVTVADEMPASVRRQPLFTGGFVCLFDPRHAKLGKKLSLERYLEHKHVVVSYNGDLRGIVEDLLGVQRDVQLSVPSFQSVGAIVDGTGLLATLPEMVARQLVTLRPHLRLAKLPFSLSGSSMDLLWSTAADDDPAVGFLRAQIVRLTAAGGAPDARFSLTGP